MQMIEVRMRYQHDVDGRQVAEAQARPAQALQHEDPAGKIWVDQDILPADLEKEAGMSDEGHAQFAPAGKYRFMSEASSGSQSRVPYQGSKLFRFALN